VYGEALSMSGEGVITLGESAILTAILKTKNALLMPNKLSQHSQLTKILHQLGVLAPPLGGFGLVPQAVSALLTTKMNLANPNELFQLLQA
jgi:hypothetical protein